MDSRERAKLKEKIVFERASLEKEIASLKEQAKPVPPDNAIGRLTRMDAIQAKSVAEAVLNEARIRQSKLETALGRIDDDEFGICMDCGEEIPMARLELVPEALKCVRCADRRS